MQEALLPRLSHLTENKEEEMRDDILKLILNHQYILVRAAGWATMNRLRAVPAIS